MKNEVLYKTSCFFLLATLGLVTCKNDPGITQTVTPAPVLHIDLLAQQSYWTVHYPGPDGILGKTHYRLISANNPAGILNTDPNAADDFVTTAALYLPKDQRVEFILRSRDVIHAAYFPHFRLNMNAVPGLPTKLQYTPLITTTEIRVKMKKPDFDYMLLCNKICGPNHYQMQMKVVVDTPENFRQWCKKSR